jgi:NADH:ubiquinone oxidoreductase subunit C
MPTDTLAPEALGEHLRQQLGERILDVSVAYGQLTVGVDPEALPQVARFCKQELELSFFDFLSGIDEREAGFSVIVRLYSHVKRQAVVLKSMVPGGRDEPRMPTLTGVYAGADWHERETYDMFGIVFDGHPGLLPRILTVENFEGWPLRKEFRLASRDVKPWPGAKEPADDGDDKAKAKDAAPAPGADPEDRAAAAKAKAERAKAKAAEARKRKAEEKAAAQAGEDTTGPQPADSASPPDDEAAAQAPASDEPAADEPAPEDRPLADEAPSGEVTEPADAEGGDPEAQGTPGVEAEGTHDLDADDSTARPSKTEGADDE